MALSILVFVLSNSAGLLFSARRYKETRQEAVVTGEDSFVLVCHLQLNIPDNIMLNLFSIGDTCLCCLALYIVYTKYVKIFLHEWCC